MMDWSRYSIPPMQLKARFGDRLVPVFCERPGSIWAMVSAAAARHPDGEALVCGDVRMNWREVVQRSAAVAAGLRKAGLGCGDRLALLLGNRIEFVLAMFAASQLGVITVLLSTRQQKPEIAYALNDCGAVMIIHEAGLAGRLPDAGDVPALKLRIAVDDSGHSAFADIANHTPLADHAEVGEEDTAMILYTSGTTGRPKGAMLAHCNIIHSAMIYQACMELTSKDRSIAAVPLAHVTGVVANIMAMVRCAGTLIIVAEFKAAD
jgi:long-chain acyl-CoA synthetase